MTKEDGVLQETSTSEVAGPWRKLKGNHSQTMMTQVLREKTVWSTGDVRTIKVTLL